MNKLISTTYLTSPLLTFLTLPIGWIITHSITPFEGFYTGIFLSILITYFITVGFFLKDSQKENFKYKLKGIIIILLYDIIISPIIFYITILTPISFIYMLIKGA